MRVRIADDHTPIRDALRSLLEVRGVEVVGEAGNGREAVALAHIHRPDVVLMDLMMPELGGLQATRLISAGLPEVTVIVLTASEDDADLFEAINVFEFMCSYNFPLLHQRCSCPFVGLCSLCSHALQHRLPPGFCFLCCL